jgi:predicted small lipoprotein YifL
MRKHPQLFYRYLAFAITMLAVVALLSACGSKGGGY